VTLAIRCAPLVFVSVGVEGDALAGAGALLLAVGA
jgi:hypothetical protein